MDELIDNYIGFYSGTDFWCAEKPDLTNLQDALALGQFLPVLVGQWDTPNFKLGVTADGMLLLHAKELIHDVPAMGRPEYFEASMAWWEKFMEQAYAFQLFVESASLQLDEERPVLTATVTPETSWTFGLMRGRIVRGNRSGEPYTSPERHRLRTYLEYVRDARQIPDGEFFLAPWPVIPSEIFATAIEQLSLVALQPGLVRWLSFIARSKVAFSRHDFEMSFVLSWFVIESAVNQMAKDSRQTEAAQRSNFYPRLQHLLHLGLISAEELKEINDLRRQRNALVHESESSTGVHSAAQRAGLIATGLALRTTGIDMLLQWHCAVRY